MNYLKFRAALLIYKVFSLRDILKVFPEFDTRRLIEWQAKGYIKKLINKWYIFSEISVNEMLLFRISNCLYRPSYVSLESAFSYYNLIPEAVYSQQAITTRKTITYETPAGTFTYRTLKPTLFFGYQVIYNEGLPVLMAEIEKALLDYLYLNAHLKTVDDLQAIRLNISALDQNVDWQKLDLYARVFNNQTLNNRINNLKELLHVNTA